MKTGIITKDYFNNSKEKQNTIDQEGKLIQTSHIKRFVQISKTYQICSIMAKLSV